MPISLGFGEWGCSYHCDSGKGKDLGKRLVRAKESRKEKIASPLTSPCHCPLRFVTSHSRFALASMRNRNPLRRRQVVGSYEVGKPTVACMALARVAVLAVPGIPFLSPFQRLPQKLVRLWTPTVRICMTVETLHNGHLGDRRNSGHLRHDYLIKCAYFDKMLFRTVCFYQWSWKLNYKCSLMALAIWVHFRSSNFRHVTDNWELTVKIFTLKWGKDNERATSSFRYISEAIKKVLINSPCMCVYVI